MENSKLLQLDFGFDLNPILKKNQKPVNKKKVKSDFVFEIMDSLTSPIIIFKSAWQEAIPKDLLEKITISRMLCLMKGEQTASITEVVAYMMPRTLEAPMPSEWVNIYTWCGLQYANQFKNISQKKEMALVMQDIAPNNLSEYEQGLLKHLRCWIYDKRRKALKASIKSKKQKKSEIIVFKQKRIFH